jgi:hypothetical protein
MYAHFYRPAQDNQGNILPNVQVTLYDPGTSNLITDTVWKDNAGITALTNPFISSNGIIDFYLLNPRRLDIVLVQGTNASTTLHDQDVLAAGQDSPHIGAGTNSTQVGVNGTSLGPNGASYGYGAQASGSQSTGLGSTSNASGNNSTAVGATSQAGGVSGVAIGYGASAAMQNSTAIGTGAIANNTNSTALGEGAQTDRNNQVAIGVSGQQATFFAAPVLIDPNGVRWQITVDINGDITTTTIV